MKINDILSLNIKKLNSVTTNNIISSVYIGDVLSFVMTHGKKNTLWLTVQTNINVIAVASYNNFSGIIFLENRYPDNETIKKATELKIPLFISSDDAFLLSKKLISIGL